MQDNVRADEKEKKMAEIKNLVMSVIDGAVQKKGTKNDSKLQSDLSAFSEDINKLISSDIKDQSSEVTFCFVLKTTFLKQIFVTRSAYLY